MKFGTMKISTCTPREPSRPVAEVSIDEGLRERLRAALARLPISEAMQGCTDIPLDVAACFIWSFTYRAREELAHREDLWWELASIKEHHRKPVAAVTTCVVAGAFEMLTGLPVTRVSKVTKEMLGQQETGQFAQLLDEVFRILEIDASPAGQIRMFKQIEANKPKPVA
jgi:hypothetical protein